MLAFAHRGGAYHPEIEGLENTLAAFRHAVELGYDYLETDVHVTRDGVLLAFHDCVLDRVTDRQGRDRRAQPTPRSARRWSAAARRCPTLAELFDAFPDARFNIDLKSDGAVTALADFIAARDAWDRVLVGSFSRRRTARFRALTGGRVPTCADAGRDRGVPAAAERPAGRGPGRPRRSTAFQIPHRRGRAHGRHAGPGAPGARGRAPRARLDHRRRRRDARAARPGRRRTLHRPHRHTQGRARRAGPVEGAVMTAADRRPAGAGCASRRPGTGTTGPTAPSSPRPPPSCSRRTSPRSPRRPPAAS